MQGIKKKALITNLVIGIVTVVLIGVLAIYYTCVIKQNVQKETRSFHGEIADQCARLLQVKISSSFSALEGMAATIGNTEFSVDDPTFRQAMTEMASSTGFQNVAVVDEKGFLYDENGKSGLNISGRDYFQEVMDGNRAVSDFINSKDQGIPVLVLAYPIRRRGSVIGGVLGRFHIGALNDLLTNPIFGGEGYAYLAKSNGQVFGRSNHPEADKNFLNIYTDFAGSSFSGPGMLEEMKRNLLQGVGGEIRYQWRDVNKIMIYVPLGINDWFLLSVMPERVVTRRSAFLLLQSVYFCGAVLVVFALGASYLLHSKRKNQLKLDAVQKEMDAEIRLNQERYRLIMEQIQDIIFEWNIPEKRIFHTEYFHKKFGYNLLTEDFPESAIGAHIIHQEDAEYLRELLRQIEAGTRYAEGDIRVRDAGENYLWCRFRLTGIQDENGQILKAIGLISDIDQQKRATEKLREHAIRDSLTGLLNRGETISRISAYLESHSGGDGYGAFLIIDLDNFKMVNDTKGHGCGDDLLRLMGEKLLLLFRESDVIGRIGGDEFVVFMADIRKGYIVGQKAKEIAEMIGSLAGDLGGDCVISCSVGISHFPQDGNVYRELLEKADKALYYAKEHGKNQYKIHEELSGDSSV